MLRCCFAQSNFASALGRWVGRDSHSRDPFSVLYFPRHYRVLRHGFSVLRYASLVLVLQPNFPDVEFDIFHPRRGGKIRSSSAVKNFRKLETLGRLCQKKNGKSFQAPKKAIRIIAKLNYRESCRESFRELGLLTLPCLYILEVITYCKSKCDLVRGGDVHQYGTRGRDNFRTSQYRLTLSQHLPQQVGVRLINKLPESIKNSNNQNQLKTRLKCLLVSKAFYSVDEFMTSRWETGEGSQLMDNNQLLHLSLSQPEASRSPVTSQMQLTSSGLRDLATGSGVFYVKIRIFSSQSLPNFFKGEPIPFLSLFCPSSWTTGLCEDLIKQNKGESIQYKIDGTDKKCKGNRQDSNLSYLILKIQRFKNLVDDSRIC
ncbi:hypothetical protein J6590_048887 [Homalodisca vitripennis]|nr:hypothetical protein J6590_048887 [Homalodisca vitripennis]